MFLGSKYIIKMCSRPGSATNAFLCI